MTSIFLKPSGRRYYVLFFIAFLALSGLLILATPILPFNPYQAAFALLVIDGLASGAVFLYYQSQYIHFEEDFITVRQGLINSRISIIPMDKIEEVKADYSIADQLLGTGSVEIDTAGTNAIEVVFMGVPQESIHTFMAAFKHFQADHGVGKGAEKETSAEEKKSPDSW